MTEQQEIDYLTAKQPTLHQCEERLRLLGLSDQQIEDLSVTIDVVGDMLLDAYFKEFYV
jgi:hypothetical protein